MQDFKNDTQSNPPTARGTGPEGRPFAWMHKDALWKIRKGFDSTTYLDQAVAVYTIHCELASDDQSPTYAATRRKIAERAGVSVRRVTEIHNRLKALMILDWKQQQIEGTKELGENLYTLLMLCMACPTLGTEEKRGNCTVVEQSSEESLLTKGRNDATDNPGTEASAAPTAIHRPAAFKERELMGRLRTLLGEDEMAHVGGNWLKNWVRKHPALVERGLNDLDCDIKEGKDKDNRAAWLVDLLKRWKSGTNNEAKSKTNFRSGRQVVDRNAGTRNQDADYSGAVDV